jgi:hypothetical protein
MEEEEDLLAPMAHLQGLVLIIFLLALDAVVCIIANHACFGQH